VLSQQGDESRRAQGGAAYSVEDPCPTRPQRERLRAVLTQRNQQPAVRSELLHQRRWHFRAAAATNIAL